MTTNDELKDLLEDIIRILEGTSPPPPPPDINQPLFSAGDSTRKVQITDTTRLRIPRVDSEGRPRYTDKGGLQFYKPTTTKKVYIGDVHVVWKPAVQGDGTRLYEMYEHPGQFLIERQILRL